MDHLRPVFTRERCAEPFYGILSLPLETQPKDPIQDMADQLHLADAILRAEDLPDGLLLLDRDLTLLHCNELACKKLGIKSSILIGRQLFQAFPAWEPVLGKTIEGVLRGEAGSVIIGGSLPGLQEHHRVRISPWGLSRTGYHGVLITMLDCTEVAELQRKLREAERMASVGKVARGVVHELNSPLDGVLRYLNLALEQSPPDSLVTEHLQKVREGLDRMRQTVWTYLEFARSATKSDRQTSDVNRAVEDALLLINHRAKFQQIRIVTDLAPNLPPVRGGHLNHVFVNLIKNACEAMSSGGSLTVATALDDSHVTVEITDTGSGIAPEDCDRVFEPFFSTKPPGRGTGLGLTLVKEVIDRVGGRVHVVSRLGVGTTFYVHLPIAASTTEESNGAHS